MPKYIIPLQKPTTLLKVTSSHITGIIFEHFSRYDKRTVLLVQKILCTFYFKSCYCQAQGQGQGQRQSQSQTSKLDPEVGSVMG